MRIQLLSLALLFFGFSIAASGDVTVVTAHQDVDLIWQGAPPYGKHDIMTSFPDDSKNYQNITMNFTIGCATNGVCSHWDYDVDIYIGEPLGYNDSTVASIDTVSQSPLVLDTTWNVFEVIEWYELGRMITPYGTYMDTGDEGFDNTWTHRFRYDVTDYEPLLHGDKPVRVHFHGWQDGFRASVDFEFTEGHPTRDVISVQNIYQGGAYENFAQFDAASTPELNISIPEDAVEAKVRFTVTGHGQDGEFTPIDYVLKSNGNEVRTEPIWRDDCGEVHTSPQGGTWIFNRANWCPGDAVEVHEFELTDYIMGSGSNKSLNIDVDFDSYSPAPGNASYSIAAHLILYKEFRRHYDVKLDAIVAPSMNENYVRFNPICDNPIVKIHNSGKENLTYCQIEYWVNQFNVRYFDWTGNLAMGESEIVVLPQMDWTGLDMNNLEFHAKVSWPNNLVDQFEHNNGLSSAFEAPPVFTANNFRIEFRSNNQPQESAYTLTDGEGNVILDESGFSANTTNNEDITLSDGCYVLEVTDYDVNWGGGDGLSWWFNNNQGLENNGYVRFRDGNSSTVLATLQPDFGSSIRLPFLVNSNLNELPSLPVSTESSHPNVTTYTTAAGIEYSVVHDTIYINENSLFYSQEANPVGINDVTNQSSLSVFPNPSIGAVVIYFAHEQNMVLPATITNILGETVAHLDVKTNSSVSFDFDDLPSGIYHIGIQLNNEMISKKIVLQNQ